MDIARSIAAEMHFQDRALARELDTWQTRTIEHPHFKVHRSQIIRLCRALSTARAQLGLFDQDSDLAPGDDALLRNLGQRRQRLHALHLMWNFFRHKLLQRMHEDFQPFLLAADDLAWSCYQPFLEALTSSADGLKEPPLTFLSMEPAPFAQARRSSFLPPGLSTLEKKLLYRCLRRMPVPLIGLPWLHVGHLPDLVLVGHETAHIVADDLALDRELTPLIDEIAAIPGSRKSHWRSWLDETFADIFGIVSGGAGYGFGLLRALAGDASAIIGEEADPRGAYPPRRVRIAVARQTAVCLQIDTAFADSWQHTYGDLSSPYSPDIEPLVTTVLNHPFERVGGESLTALLQPPSRRTVKKYIDMLVEESSPPSGPPDIRSAIAAAAIAHARRPDVWREADEHGPPARLSRHLRDGRTDGHRNEDSLAVKLRHLSEADAELDSERMLAEDDAIGAAIASVLRG